MIATEDLVECSSDIFSPVQVSSSYRNTISTLSRGQVSKSAMYIVWTIKVNVDSRTKFELLFLKQYWSWETQKGIKQRLEVERLRQEDRAEHFNGRVITLRSM